MTNLKKHIDYWRWSAEHDWQTTELLFKGKRYDACLFFCHLVLEKLLKGLVVKQTEQIPPKIHDLERLALLAKVPVSEKQLALFRIINNFNIAGRYDPIKLEFFKRCTPAYTKKYFKISKNLYLWLAKQYPNQSKTK